MARLMPDQRRGGCQVGDFAPCGTGSAGRNTVATRPITPTRASVIIARAYDRSTSSATRIVPATAVPSDEPRGQQDADRRRGEDHARLDRVVPANHLEIGRDDERGSDEDQPLDVLRKKAKVRYLVGEQDRRQQRLLVPALQGASMAEEPRHQQGTDDEDDHHHRDVVVRLKDAGDQTDKPGGREGRSRCVGGTGPLRLRRRATSSPHVGAPWASGRSTGLGRTDLGTFARTAFLTATRRRCRSIGRPSSVAPVGQVGAAPENG